MGKTFTLAGKYQLVPEGWNVLQIVYTNWDEANKRITIRFKDKKNRYHTDFFNLVKKSGDENPMAMTSFSNLVRVAMQDESLRTIDLDLLQDKFIRAEIEHEEWDGKMRTRIRQREMADGFENKQVSSEEDDHSVSLDEWLSED